jgi:hypothetical protein
MFPLLLPAAADMHHGLLPCKRHAARGHRCRRQSVQPTVRVPLACECGCGQRADTGGVSNTCLGAGIRRQTGKRADRRPLCGECGHMWLYARTLCTTRLFDLLFMWQRADTVGVSDTGVGIRWQTGECTVRRPLRGEW